MTGEGRPDRVRVAAAVAWRDERVLLTQRPPGGPLGLLWEFPGGKIEPGETPERALSREIEEELGVRGTTGPVLAVHRHAYPHGLEVEIHFIRCELESLVFRPHPAVHAVRWVRPAEVDPAELLAGDRDFFATLGAARKGDDGAA